ncbi:MAG: hypothetical protein JXB49_32945 [Bacteroidales bacterium]|nr:hypothetical protein [Bacteroidales bacterium]
MPKITFCVRFGGNLDYIKVVIGKIIILHGPFLILEQQIKMEIYITLLTSFEK